MLYLAHTHGLPALEQAACLGLAAHLRPPAALPHLRRAADVLAHERQQMPVEELKAHLLTGHAAVYTRLISAYRSSKQPRLAAQTLLEAKGGMWADLAAPVQAVPPDPDWLQARTALTSWQEELRLATDPAYRARCEQQVQSAEAALIAATRQQQRQRAPQPIPTLDMVQQCLPANSVLVEYLVETTHLVACVLAADQEPRWLRLGKTADLVTCLGRLSLLLRSLHAPPTPAQRFALAQAQQAGFHTCLADIAALVLTPLLPYLPPTGSLLLAPDGLLFQVPWAALPMPSGLLGQHYPLVLLPSGVVLALADSASGSAPHCSAPLALGYAGDPPLAHVAAELAALQQVIPALRCCLPATRPDLTWEAPPRWLHIAAHGHMQPHAPLLSRLELADGAFLLADVLTLPLHGTQLVTLSACDTGVLPEQGGMLLALAGAFLCAGAQTVMASLWPVEDAATSILMSHFYAAVQQGVPVPQALAQAQQAVQAAGYTYPCYWAAFHLLARTLPPA